MCRHIDMYSIHSTQVFQPSYCSFMCFFLLVNGHLFLCLTCLSYILYCEILSYLLTVFIILFYSLSFQSLFCLPDPGPLLDMCSAYALKMLDDLSFFKWIVCFW